MQLYVVVGGAAGKKAIAVFSTRERALTFIDERGVRHAQIEERELPAGYQYPDEVFAAHISQPEQNGLVFADLYIDAQEAEQAAGKGGAALTFRPDGKAVEDIH